MCIAQCICAADAGGMRNASTWCREQIDIFVAHGIGGYPAPPSLAETDMRHTKLI